MSETPTKAHAESATQKAVKDKNCKFCGQAFTSSSLGRHLDLYIREHNPKAPDGVHDVEAIRKIRGGVTRRQVNKGSGGSDRRYSATSPATPTAASKKSPAASEDAVSATSPVTRKDSATQLASSYPFNTHRWETTGVINNIPDQEVNGEREQGSSHLAAPGPSRQQPDVNGELQKAQPDMMSKMQDAMDTARAAELALREMISSWRAAKIHIGMDSMPFDFDPLSFDFPALTLQCLEAPPTLFSLHPFPTKSSWSIQPPGEQQYAALLAYFKEEFRKWRITCAAATTAVQEDLQYPPSDLAFKDDTREAVRRAEKLADTLESKVNEHVRIAYVNWEGLPQQQKHDSWVMELARSLGRKQKQIDNMQEALHNLRQENANMKSQIEHLNRLQQPREFKITPPATFPVPRKLLNFWQEEGVVHDRRAVGLSIDDRHSDLGTVVSLAIDRWKHVIVSTRTSGSVRAGKRTADQAGLAGIDTANNASSSAAAGPTKSRAISTAEDRPRPRSGRLHTSDKPSLPKAAADAQEARMASSGALGASATMTDRSTSNASASAASRIDTDGVDGMSDQDADSDGDGDDLSDRDAHAEKDDGMSDQDADAEMEDDDALAYATEIPSQNGKEPAPARPHTVQIQQQHQLPAAASQSSNGLEVPRVKVQGLIPGTASPTTGGIAAQPGTSNFTHPRHGGRGGIGASSTVQFPNGSAAMQQFQQPQQQLHSRQLHPATGRAGINMAMQEAGGSTEPVRVDLGG